MHFLTRRSAEPLRLSADLDIAGGRSAAPADTFPQEKSPSRVLKRVTTLFNPRKRTLSKNTSPTCHGAGAHGAVGFIRDAAAVYPRSSSDSSTESPEEIRRPSGLGRRASLMESPSESINLERFSGNGGEARVSRSLPDLLNNLTHSFRIGSLAEHPTIAGVAIQSLPMQLLEIILSFLPKSDVLRIALVSAQFCKASRNALYRILDFQSISEPQVEKLCKILANHTSLAARVQSLSCHFWPATTSTDGHLIPSLDLTTALHNMSNLESLTIRTFVPVFSQSPPLAFRLKTLVILDDTISLEQVTDILHFLRNQTSLQCLAFPNVVENPFSPECSPQHHIFASGLAREPILPALSQLHAPPQLTMTICSLLGQALDSVVLDVTTTLFTGLRPAALLRAIQGVSKLDVVFTHEVDKRTVEKFLGAAGGILSGSGASNSRGLITLEVEVLWMEDETAEILYDIIDAVISRFNGLRTLKLITPFRSRQSQLLTPSVSGSLPLSVPSHTPTTPSFGLSSMLITSPVGGVLPSEFVSSGTEKTHAKMWTKACPTLNDIQFCFPDPSPEADVALCGVWFHRKE
ncbi:hypothetical protein DEU56DRAFT_558687 [Suillus clintonianus]|uniref:uncharacterized protein n=1 Tax=Suillus clintonianus TaxID=1904413 RepID=UPI001B870482|nr:uncharacterized protein DEU56DRAFT_558687 [Suillus clintonianus]KAG2126060.1 hypothetical protein DEU56DRAFT_558687 [Suillus clintonianus]